ncbi:MAG: hypothetical protein ACTHW2_12285 [Tissierella sp.]|uniref:hypothetical protein n=1 Tax=Tissierella sp. TaxID=41274 RepID=UPI003F965FD7
MKKKVFVLLEIVIPLVFFLSWMIWNLVVKSYSFKEAFETSTGITFMIIIIFNLLVAFNYKKILDEY